MCLIIASPYGTAAPREYVRNGFENNPHGWGVMWAERGRVRVAKGYKLSSLRKALARLPETPHVIHFRYATHGDHSLANLHPFNVGNGTYMMHNGIIRGYKETRKDRSDTWHLAQEIRQAGAPVIPVGELEKRIGSGNKLTFLYPNGDIDIANEKQGEWIGDLWLSNEYSIYPAAKWWAEPEPRDAWEDWRIDPYTGEVVSADGRVLSQEELELAWAAGGAR